MKPSPAPVEAVEVVEAAQDAAPVEAAAETEALGTPADAMMDAVTATQQGAIETMETARTSMVEGLSQVQREIADFVSERIRHDMETQKALLRCRTFEEVRNVQADFFRTAVDHYSTEATRLMKIGTDIVSKSMDRG